MTWVFLVLGLIIGWLLYLLADTFFWRDRRVCTDLERGLQSSVAELEGKNAALHTRVGELDVEAGKVPALRAALDARGAELEGLNASLNAKDAEIDGYNIRIGDLETANGNLSGQIGTLEASLAERDGQIATLNTELGDLNMQLGERNSEIARLNGQVGSVDSELKGWGLGALAAGGLMALRERFMGMKADIETKDSEIDSMQLTAEDASVKLGALTADIEAKDAKIGDLNAQIAGLNADLGERNAQIDGLNAEIDLKNGEIGNLNTQIAGLNADIAGRDSQIAGLNVDLDGKTSEIDGLNLQLGDLRGQLADVDNELSGLNIDANAGAAAAGTGLGLAGLIGWLRGRKDSLETDMADRDSQLVALNAQVETDRVGYEQRIGDLEAQLAALDAKDAEISSLAAQVGGLNVDIEGKHAEIATLNAQIAGLNADLEGRDAQIGSLNARIGELDAEMTASTEKHSAEVDDVLNNLLERDNELALLRGELASVQGELDGLSIDANGGTDSEVNVNAAALAGGGLGLAGLVAWLRGRKDSLETDVAERNGQILALNAKVETDAETFKLDRGRYNQRIGDLEAMLAERDVTIGTLRASMPPDDLTRVWGIGPKIAAALNEAGIKSYSQLAETEDDAITEILETSGVNYRLAGPGVRATWQEQAELLAAGDLDELKLRQAQFKRSGGGLGKVWGIGSKVTGLLAAVGVTNYTELATSTTADISDALHAAKGYYPGMSNAEIHQSWVQQSSLAANSQWTALKNYQARFRRGRAVAKPDDLKRIWGIGPKIEKVLNKHDIYTFAKLAETSLTEIDEILEEAGSRFNTMMSETLRVNWTTQARLASVGDWDAFQELYDKLTWDNVQDND